MKKLTIVLISFLFIGFLGSSEPKEDFWDKFSPIVKERVNTLIINKDCKGLQKEFDTTESNSQMNRKRGRSSSHFVDLM
tara:strand:- start:317 stop:553 length:237 start_codon:yes stop_codon:yes gene_type:complete